MVELLNDDEFAGHDDPMAGEGTDIGINARGFWGGEGKREGLSRFYHGGVKENFFTVGDVLFFDAFDAEGDGRHAKGIGIGAWLADDDVMLHFVVVVVVNHIVIFCWPIYCCCRWWYW